MTNLNLPSERHAALVAPSDVAEMAGVSRGAVSNWRKRSADFPNPVAGTPAKPLFNRSEIEAWLTATGKTVVTDHNLSAWSLLNTLRGHLTYEDITQLALDMACVRRLHESSDAPNTTWATFDPDNGVPLNDALQRDVDQLHDTLSLPRVPRRYLELDPRKLALVALPFQAIPVTELPEVIDYVLARAASAQVRAGLQHGFVESRISRILGALAGPDAAGTIYDPACGIGEALTRVIKAHKADPEQTMGPITHVVGHDIDPAATTIARQRAFLRGDDWEIVTADVLAHDPDPDLKADIVVCEPPLGQRLEHVELSDARWRYGMPPRNSTELAWVQHVLAHLAPNGRGFVVTTMGALARGGPDGAIRRGLIETNSVEAIIGLPAKLLPHVAMPLAVWVLRPGNDDGSPDEVLIVDGSRSTNPEAEVRSWYPDSPHDTPADFIPPATLATAAYDLTPARWTGAASLDSDVAFSAYTESLQKLNRALDRLSMLERPLAAFDPLDRPRVVTIGDLIDGGVVQLKTGRLRPQDAPHYLAENIIQPRHVRQGELPDRVPGELVGAPEVVFDDWHHKIENHPDRPQPGDVLITTTDPISTMVFGVETAVLGAGVQSLRILTDQITPQYLAAVLRGEWNKRFLSGSTITRAKVQDLEVPLLSSDEQELYLEAYDRVLEVAEQADLLSRWAQDTRVALLDLLRAGAPMKDAQ